MSLAITKAISSVAGIYMSGPYLMFLIGGVALLTALVAKSFWRSRQLDLTWLVVIIAMFSLLVANGSLNFYQPRSGKLKADQAQAQPPARLQSRQVHEWVKAERTFARLHSTPRSSKFDAVCPSSNAALRWRRT